MDVDTAPPAGKKNKKVKKTKAAAAPAPMQE
jgi:hypothetical protein